jgi:hypothetical protein
MKRRSLLEWMISAAAVLPFARLRLLAQPRELTPDAIATLREIAPTVLPASLGPARIGDAVEKFVAWTRGYRENVALAHGYGHPRLQKTPPSPVPGYVAQLAALDADARKRGGRWSTLDVEARRALLDAAFTKAGVRNLPQRPNGQHVVSDLMAFYFRSSEANDYCYGALIQREVCRPIAITTKRPAPLGGQNDERRDRGERRENPLEVSAISATSADSALIVVAEDPHAGS